MVRRRRANLPARHLTGDFVLHTALPGAHVEDAAQASELALARRMPADAVRVGPIPEWGQATGESEVVLVPLSVSGPADWVLALIGALPPDAESLFAILGRIAAVQLETIRIEAPGSHAGAVSIAGRARGRRSRAARRAAGSRAGRHDAGRLRLPGLNRAGARAPPRVASAARARLPRGRPWRRRRAPLRTGAASSARCRWAKTRRRLSISCPRRRAFRPDAELVTRVATRVLQVLAGRRRVVCRTSLARYADRRCRSSCGASKRSSSARRRFDLRLSLVLIDMPPRRRAPRACRPRRCRTPCARSCAGRTCSAR